jgi:hypothetical protein
VGLSGAVTARSTPYTDWVAAWVEQLCAIASIRSRVNASVRQLFESATPELSERSAFLAAVTDWLRKHPALVDQWYGYSMDKRGSPSPYLEVDPTGVPLEVGFYDKNLGRLDVSHHVDAAEACADFIYREASWVLRRERVR